MKDSYILGQDYELWALLYQTRDAIFLAREKELSAYDITTMKASVLFVANSIGDDATPAEIARWLMRKAHSVSGLLQRMEKDGLIEKTKDLKRKNMVRVTITDKGHEALQFARKKDFIPRQGDSVVARLFENSRISPFSRYC